MLEQTGVGSNNALILVEAKKHVRLTRSVKKATPEKTRDNHQS